MRFRLAAPAFLTAAVLAVAVGVPAHAAGDEAERKAEIDRQVAAAQQGLDDTSAELAAAHQALADVRSQLAAAQARVASARAEAEAARAQDAQLAADLAVAVAEAAKAERQLAETVQKMQESQELIGRIARASYRGNEMGQISVLLETSTPQELVDKLMLNRTAIRSEGAVLADLAETKADLTEARATLDARRDQVSGMKAEQERVVAAKAAAETDATTAQSQVQSLADAQAGAVAALDAQKAAEEQRVAAMQAESSQLQALLAERARAARAQAAAASAGATDRASRSGGSTAVSNGALLKPVDGRRTSPFGMRVNPVTGIYKLHDGTDFGIAMGTPVKAAADGTVVSARMAGGYGNQLVLDNGMVNGEAVATSYNHLSSFAVSPGTQVKRGDVVAYSGNTGNSTGPHLHFIVYVDGTPVDPEGWL